MAMAVAVGDVVPAAVSLTEVVTKLVTAGDAESAAVPLISSGCSVDAHSRSSSVQGNEIRNKVRSRFEAFENIKQKREFSQLINVTTADSPKHYPYSQFDLPFCSTRCGEFDGVDCIFQIN